MTYIRPFQFPTAIAGPLDDADAVAVIQNGVTRRATLATFKAFLAAGTAGGTGSTGGTGGSTGSTGGTGGTTGGVALAGRLGYAAVTTAVRNTATTPATVTVPQAPSRSLPAYTAYNANESPNGKVLNSTNYSTDRIVYRDGTVLTLVQSTVVSGAFRVLINGSDLAGRVDLEDFNSQSRDGVFEAVYYYHRSYLRVNYIGIPAGDTWLVVEGDQAPITDCDTEGDDPRRSFLVADAVAPVGDPPYGLGAHPGSIGDEPRFGTYLAQFVKEIGNVSYVNAFADAGDFSKWPNDAYAAASDLYNVAANKSVIPVYGLPMARGGQGINDFNAFAAGTYDQYIKDGVKGYLNYFDEVHVRPGYEMNGTFMNWFWGGQDGTNTSGNAWVAAFKRIYTMAHQAAAEASASSGKTKTVMVTWNPCHQNYNASYNPKNMYPGNDFVDYHGLDIYSPQYTQGPDNWSGDGQVYSSTQAVWRVQQAANPVNRIHFWDYPNASADHGPTGGEGGWGMIDAINFAKACGKPLAIPECGSGQNFSDRGIGPAEDDVFPYYLRSRLDMATNLGVPVLYANIWSGDEKDGGWGCLFRQRAKTAIAWSSAFGGTGAALKYAGGTTSGSGTTTTGGGAGGTPTTTASLATAAITDYYGHSATITLPATPAAGEPAFYQAQTGLSVDIYYYADGNGQLTIGSSSDGVITSMVITENGNSVLASNGLVGVTTYLASSNSTGPYSTAATVIVSDTNGKSVPIALDGQPPMNFYSSNTGLACDIYYFVAADGSLILDGSADGVIASAVVTRNGSTVTSLMPGTTYK